MPSPIESMVAECVAGTRFYGCDVSDRDDLREFMYWPTEEKYVPDVYELAERYSKQGVRCWVREVDHGLHIECALNALRGGDYHAGGAFPWDDRTNPAI